MWSWRAASMTVVPLGTAISLPSMLTVTRSGVAGWIIAGRENNGDRSDEDAAVGGEGFFNLRVAVELVLELGDEALGGPRAGFAEGADGAAGDLVGDGLEQLAVLGTGVAVDHAAGDFFHPQGAF